MRSIKFIVLDIRLDAIRGRREQHDAEIGDLLINLTLVRVEAAFTCPTTIN